MNPIILAVGAGFALDGLYDIVKKLFGHGNPPPARPELPAPPGMTPGTNLPGEQNNIDQNQKKSGLLGDQAMQGPQHANDVASTIADLKKKVDEIYKDAKTNTDRLKNGGTPQTQAQAHQAERDGAAQLKDTVGNGARTVGEMARQLTMPGGMMGAGMPMMGGGMGSPLGGLLSPLASIPGMLGGAMGGGGGMGSPLAAPAGLSGWRPPTNEHVPSPLDPPAPPKPNDAAGTPPSAGGRGGGAGPAPTTPLAGTSPKPSSQPVTPAPASAPLLPVSHDVTTSDGKNHTTAPDDTAAKALRHAVDHPNDPHMAETAYKTAGVTLPGNGVDPGQNVDLSHAQPGDIVRLADHDDMIWDRDHALTPDGKLIPVGDALASGALKGVYHVQRATSGQPDVTLSHSDAGQT